MIRKIKALSLALVALCAMSAVVAAGAQAGNFTTSGSYPSPGKGEQPKEAAHVFTVQGQKVTCTKAVFEGSLAAASESIVITPTYTGCTAFGFAEAEVNMGECVYTFTAGVTKTVPTHYWEGSVHIVNKNNHETACSITINAPKTSPVCVVHVPNQTPTTPTVDFENATPFHVLVTSTVAGIHSVVTKNSFLCPLNASATDTTGTYTGTVEFKSTEGKEIHVK